MNIFISHYMQNMIEDTWSDISTTYNYVGGCGSAHCGNIDDPEWIDFLHAALDEWIEAARKYGDQFTDDDEIVIQICNVHKHDEKSD